MIVSSSFAPLVTKSVNKTIGSKILKVFVIEFVEETHFDFVAFLTFLLKRTFVLIAASGIDVVIPDRKTS